MTLAEKLSYIGGTGFFDVTPIYRVPLGGRNFEYMNGEDPFLDGQLVPEVIQGIQSEGVWSCAKHYVCMMR